MYERVTHLNKCLFRCTDSEDLQWLETPACFVTSGLGRSPSAAHPLQVAVPETAG